VIHALHGFLGSGKDWEFLREVGLEIEAPDLFTGFPIAESMEAWAEQFLENVHGRTGVILSRRSTPKDPEVESRAEEGTASILSGIQVRGPSPSSRLRMTPENAEAEPTLLGYSLGGRLALHVLLADREHHIGKAVIVSAGLGIEGAEARAARRASDARWAARFESGAWTGVVRDWNAQPLFGGRENANLRLESAFDRRALAAALRDWSPAVHEPLAGRLHDITARVLWIAGEDDERYVAEGQRAVERLPNAELWICRGAGHRVPWEQPERFLERLRTFLEEKD
jgi:2-succinyl-6-hydroxy-2,4-cyclohexadiene-1-carboxylate synthase